MAAIRCLNGARTPGRVLLLHRGAAARLSAAEDSRRASTPVCRKAWRRRSGSSPCSISSPQIRDRAARRDAACQRRRGALRRMSTSPIEAGAQALRGVTLDIPAGKTVALVGASGAGKSTIMNLIPRFYDVGAGAVLIDGQDVRDVTLASLRAAIGAGQPGGQPLRRHGARQHRLWPLRRRARTRSSPPPKPRPPTISSAPCRKATTRWSASTA